MTKDKCNETWKGPEKADLLLVDCIYYKGVREGMENHLKNNPSSRAMMVMNMVKNVNGIHRYYDCEGYCLVRDNYVINNPKGNDKPYSHSILFLPFEFVNYSSNGFHYAMLKSVNIGPTVR